jgi:hypothetical protein
MLRKDNMEAASSWMISRVGSRCDDDEENLPAPMRDWPSCISFSEAVILKVPGRRDRTACQH